MPTLLRDRRLLEGDHRIERFYFKLPYGLEMFESLAVEVTKEQWLRAESGSGFRNHGRPGEPATGGFSASNGMRGDRDTFATTIKVPGNLVCEHCENAIGLVTEEHYVIGGIERRDAWRHLDGEYPHEMGPIECRLPVIQLRANPPEL